MFRKLKESPYFKAAVTLLICGVALILFHNWISTTKFSVGLSKLNKTLAPLYVGVIFAFVLCPVYNSIVKGCYRGLLKGTAKEGFSIGKLLIPEAGAEHELNKDEKRKLLNTARTIASFVCVVVVVGLISMLIYFVVPQVISSIASLVYTMPQRLASLSTWCRTHLPHFPIVAAWVDSIANADNTAVIEWLQEHVLSGNAANIASMISSGVVAALKYVVNTFIGLLIMVYLLNYKERLFAITRKIVNATCGQKRKAALYEFARIVNETFIGFIVGRIIDSFIIGVLTFVVLKIFSIPFALMIGVIVGITNVIPFFGPFIGAIPSAFILMLEKPVAALYFLIIILIIQQIDGNIIGPKVVGNAIGISSFWVLLAVLIGGGMFGFGGMALGVPVFAVIYRYVDKLTTRSLKKKEKDPSTGYYYSLEPFGMEDDEVELDNPHKEGSSIFDRLLRSRREPREHRYLREPGSTPGDTDDISGGGEY